MRGVPAGTSESMTYQEMRRQVQAAGLMDRSGWHSVPVALVALLIGALALAILGLAPGAWRLIAAPFLAIFWMQIGFFGHDSGHNQVFVRTEHNRRLGLICFPLLLGMTFRPWVIKHNLHHAETNVVDADPDLQNPLLAFTPEAAREKRGVLRWLVRYQAYAYPVLALFATIGFRVDAWRYALGHPAALPRGDKYDGERRLELVLLCSNLILWVVLPSLWFGWGIWLPIFVLAQMLLGVHMAFVFAPNHKGMPTFADASHLTFAEQQVLTSRNVAGSLLADFMYGGLNYQVEHHLFPTMPRKNMRACREYVRHFCRETNLPYAEESVIQSFKSLFSSLDELGREVYAEIPSRAPIAP